MVSWINSILSRYQYRLQQIDSVLKNISTSIYELIRSKRLSDAAKFSNVLVDLYSELKLMYDNVDLMQRIRGIDVETLSSIRESRANIQAMINTIRDIAYSIKSVGDSRIKSIADRKMQTVDVKSLVSISDVKYSSMMLEYMLDKLALYMARFSNIDIRSESFSTGVVDKISAVAQRDEVLGYAVEAIKTALETPSPELSEPLVEMAEIISEYRQETEKDEKKKKEKKKKLAEKAGKVLEKIKRIGRKVIEKAKRVPETVRRIPEKVKGIVERAPKPIKYIGWGFLGALMVGGGFMLMMYMISGGLGLMSSEEVRQGIESIMNFIFNMVGLYMMVRIMETMIKLMPYLMASTSTYVTA